MNRPQLLQRIADLEATQSLATEVLIEATCLILEAIQNGKVPGPEAFRAYVKSERGLK